VRIQLQDSCGVCPLFATAGEFDDGESRDRSLTGELHSEKSRYRFAPTNNRHFEPPRGAHFQILRGLEDFGQSFLFRLWGLVVDFSA